MHVVAILETAWGGDRELRYFKINRDNHSGRRLVGDASLMVTNACREMVASATQHGTPDPAWLRENLAIMERHRHIDVLLVCGKVAQKTYAQTGHVAGVTRIIQMPHPAARQGWTKESIAAYQAQIQGG